ncbi:hypothetical protein F2Q69_00012777 [Brassica cretica]|uniref:Uncharacterized protein n=1 Tax=Brassica cretica TaxID=69181 RepID=A0A8S9QPU0_BRACR|nr:hypothetical protein F2Q69_00012777 [Brassica cretica]
MVILEPFEMQNCTNASDVNQHPVAEVILILLRSGQSASLEEAVENRNENLSLDLLDLQLLLSLDLLTLQLQIHFLPHVQMGWLFTGHLSTCQSVPGGARRNYFSSQTKHIWNARLAKRNAHHRSKLLYYVDRDENGDLHDPGGHLCNAAGQKIDGQGTEILEPSAVTEDAKVSLQRTLADLIWPISLVEQDVEKDENQDQIQMMEKILKIQQKMSAYLNLRLDVLYKELNGKFETLDVHVMMLDAQVSHTAEAVKKQEALVKGKAVESEKHEVNASSDDDLGEVLEQEKLEEDAFLVESSMSIGSSYWCRPTPTTEHRSTSTAEHRSTSSAEHRSTPLLGSDKTVRIQSHSDFAARHPHPPTLARVKSDNVNRQQHEKIDRQQHGSIDRQQEKSSDRQPSMPYRVRLPDLDTHRLKATRNLSQTSVCLKTAEKISQQSAEAPEQEQSALAETSFVESVDRPHLPGIGRHLISLKLP